MSRIRFLLAAGLCIWLGSASAHACAVCFGDPTSPLGKGLFWGVVALFAIVVAVLGGIVSFFVYIARRASRMTLEIPGPVDSSSN